MIWLAMWLGCATEEPLEDLVYVDVDADTDTDTDADSDTDADTDGDTGALPTGRMPTGDTGGEPTEPEWTLEAVDGMPCGTTAIALADGGPLLVFQRFSPAPEVWVAWRTGSGWQGERLDDAALVGDEVAITVAADGTVWIAYAAFDGIRVAAGGPGAWTSLDLGPPPQGPVSIAAVGSGAEVLYTDLQGAVVLESTTGRSSVLDAPSGTRASVGVLGVGTAGDRHAAIVNGDDLILRLLSEDGLGGWSELELAVGGTAASLWADGPSVVAMDFLTEEVVYLEPDGAGGVDRTQLGRRQGTSSSGTALVHDAAGYAHASWHASATGDLAYAWRDLQGVWTPEGVDVTDVGHPDLAVSGTQPFLSYCSRSGAVVATRTPL